MEWKEGQEMIRKGRGERKGDCTIKERSKRERKEGERRNEIETRERKGKGIKIK